MASSETIPIVLTPSSETKQNCQKKYEIFKIDFFFFFFWVTWHQTMSPSLKVNEVVGEQKLPTEIYTFNNK